ncbi:MAG: DUF11 domain-containing protein, partial [Gemmataceae bacterium]|nr:DUF11 domain-containing protein [Gemmataceae bacterium]
GTEPPIEGQSSPKPIPSKSFMGTFSPTDPPAPFVTIRVRVSAQASPNDELEYRILVENHSPAEAHQVRIRNNIPTNAKFVRASPPPDSLEGELIWKLGSLPGNSSKEIKLVVMVTGTGEVDCISRVQYEHGQAVKTQLASPLLLKMTGPIQAMLYDTLSYQIDVFNTGNSELTGVQLTNIIPEGLEFLTSKPSTNGENPLVWNIGSIPGGQSKRLEFQAAVKKTGEFINKATVTTSSGMKKETSSKVEVGEIKLALNMGGPDRRNINRPASYQITITNSGNQIVRGIKVSNKLDPSTQFLAASGGGRYENGEVKWLIPQLAPKQRQIVQMVIKPTVAGTLKNRTEVTADKIPTGWQVEKITVFEINNGLVTEIDKSIDPMEIGEQTALTIRLINYGQNPIKNLILTAISPDTTVVTEGRGPTNFSRQPDKVGFLPLPSLEPGKEVTYSLFLQAKKPGDGTFRLEYTADEGISGKAEETISILPSSKAPASNEPPALP